MPASGNQVPAALRFCHVYSLGAQSLKENFNILSFQRVGLGQSELVELVEGDEPGPIADFNGSSDDGL
jgi:hypothetical protein